MKSDIVFMLMFGIACSHLKRIADCFEYFKEESEKALQQKNDN